MRRLYPLRVPRTSALPAASFRFPVARDTLAVRLTFPLTGHVEDLHLQVSAPCRAHETNGPAGCPAGPLPFYWSKSVRPSRAVAPCPLRASRGRAVPVCLAPG